MASGGLINTNLLSDETFDFLCTMCKRKDRNREAERYCVDCDDYYCLSCVKVHEDVPPLTKHQILIKSQFLQRTSKTPPMLPTERCEKHVHKLVDMYCNNHDDVCCAICLATDHRSCQDIFYIPDFIKNNTNIPTGDDKSSLELTMKKANEYEDKLQHEKQQLLANKANALENIRTSTEEITERLNELKEKSVSNVESVYKTYTNETEKKISMLQSNKTRVKSAQDNIESAGNNLPQVFVSNKIKSRAANALQQVLDEIDILSPDNIPEFRADEKILGLLNKFEGLGKIIKRHDNTHTATPDVEGKTARYLTDEHIFASNMTAEDGDGLDTVTTEHTSNIKITAGSKTKSNTATGNKASRKVAAEQEVSTATEKTATYKERNKNVLLQIKEKSVYCVKTESDPTTCDINSVCTMEDGTIILSDYFHKKLKSFDCSIYKIKDSCDLPRRPWQVCAINHQEVAVSLADKQISFIFVSKMTKIKTIQMDHDCYGLSYANGNLYISDNDTSVYVYTCTMSGRKLKQFSNDLFKSQSLFDRWIRVSLKGLAVNEDGSRIYLTHRSNGLIVLDDSGQIVGHYNDKQLNLAFGCHFITGMGVLVCGLESNNVLQFGPSGELIGEILMSDGGKYTCKTVCCNEQMSKMIVCRGDTDNIEIYDLV
ncbi:uncharacterized protein LOC128548511 [Mercenaria mercenaria]|uniref:uncharacterized protein LOC128548511 n=1 Tax=Mercenaria mercenaria TaxID=6596 RepID=UPI00234F948F|nr:uncharacterized protein LOC128548511 [Mercenaria mercenaria]